MVSYLLIECLSKALLEEQKHVWLQLNKLYSILIVSRELCLHTVSGGFNMQFKHQHVNEAWSYANREREMPNTNVPIYHLAIFWKRAINALPYKQQQQQQ